MTLAIVPITQREALAYVDEYHRHHEPPRGGILHIACVDLERHDQPGVFAPRCIDTQDGPRIVGVAIAGRPVARMLDDGFTIECTRCCTDGTRNASSKLYGALWRAARALGYRRMVTYTLPRESGESLRGAGFRLLGQTRGGSWNRQNRPRIDTHPLQEKLRWELS